jgi:hypothetical protein
MIVSELSDDEEDAWLDQDTPILFILGLEECATQAKPRFRQGMGK